MYCFVPVNANGTEELPLKAPVAFMSKTMAILVVADLDKAEKYARVIKSHMKTLGTYEVREYTGTEPTIEKYWSNMSSDRY